ncbi:hypothetical protein GGR57DRAFT_509166 [Xylariaceae sp. FL1272]|nr:hypothetical protein GGR57DRAFT_509166 [Xylariaceae sp. FL1272]
MGPHSSQKYKSSHSSTPRSSKPGRSSKDNDTEPQVSFLFVVNELEVDPVHDQWGTRVPPNEPSSFQETPGRVFRYHNGVITPAESYFWYREAGADGYGYRPQGSIYGNDQFAKETYPTIARSTFAVFNCWRPVPCVYVDIDPMSTPMGPERGEGVVWRLMSFLNPDETGITRIAVHGGSPVASGRGPSWIPCLVPSMFRVLDHAPHPPRSRGLAGCLPVIIGQMALTHGRGHTDFPFMQQTWRHRHWDAGDLNAEIADPSDLRGVLVHIAYDPEHPDISHDGTLDSFELDQVIVKEKSERSR